MEFKRSHTNDRFINTAVIGMSDNEGLIRDCL